MQQSSSLSTKSYNSTVCGIYDQQRKNPSSVNWVSVISFLEVIFTYSQNQYTKSSVREKQWFLEKKILNQGILKLKNQLSAVQSLNSSLNNRIKLLQNALRRQKLTKCSSVENKQDKALDKIRNIQAVEKYFEKNGWNLSQKPKSSGQNIHKKFLNKVLDEVGINFSKIQQKCRNMSLNSTDTDRKDKTQSFQNLVNEINKVKFSTRIKINAHLDSVRGICSSKNSLSQTLIASVSQDCLLKLWTFDYKNKQKNQSIEPVSCFRQHTGQLFALDGGNVSPANDDFILFTGGTQQCLKVWYTPSVDKPESVKCIGSFFNQKTQTDQTCRQQNQIIWHLKYKEKKLLTSASDGIVRLFKTDVQNNLNRASPVISLVGQYAEKNYLQNVIEWVGQRGFLTGCSNSPRIHLWDIQKSKVMQKYTYEIEKPKEEKNVQKRQNNFSSSFQINSLKYISDYKTIYAGCEDKAIRIFSYDQNKMIKKLDIGINDSINCIQFYKSNFIVAGCQNGSIKVWDRRTYRLIIDESSHKTKYDEGILCLRTSQHGIITGGADGVINYYGI